MMGAAGSGGAKTYVEDVFSTWLYTGNGSTQTITNGIDLSVKGGLVWIKSRNIAGSAQVDSLIPQYNHFLFDTLRTNQNALNTASNFGQDSTWGALYLNFLSTGFNVGNASNIYTNESATTYASWTFRKAEKFFDVCTWSGSGANRTISHNLGSVPGCIIVKRTNTTGDWQVYHRSLANTEYMVLNSSAAKATGATRWNSTTPTSTVFSLGTDATVNASGGTYVAYLFAHDAGGFGDSGNDNVVSCGSFTTDGSGNATVTLGWEPQWILTKRSSDSGNWILVDSMRGITTGGNDAALRPNTSGAETSVSEYALSATGFSLAGGDSSSTFIYIAIRRGPMKTPTDATKVFYPDAVNTSAGQQRTTGFPVDWQILRNGRDLDVGNFGVTRLTGVSTVDTDQTTPFLRTYDTSAQSNSELTRYWDNSGYKITAASASRNAWFLNFRRAPGFFDVVAYTGDSNTSTTTVAHGLTVQPELMIFKNRSAVGGWDTYVPSNASNYYLTRLNSTGAQLVGDISKSNASSSTVLKVGWLSGNVSGINDSGNNYIAYLFASCPGVSKVGNYTGTGTTLNIDCGFTAGARFVLIKRTDSTGDWYVWDTARGIVSGNDPYLLLNSTAAEVTNTDYIDPLSSGFQISSTAPAAINANGGSYIYLSIA